MTSPPARRTTTAHDDHEHDDFDTIVVDLPEVTDPEALAAAIVRLAEEQKILRVKGHVAVAGKPMRMLVQAVGARVRMQYDRPWGAAPAPVAAGGHRRTSTTSTKPRSARFWGPDTVEPLPRHPVGRSASLPPPWGRAGVGGPPPGGSDARRLSRKLMGWRKPKPRSTAGRTRPIWWSSRFPTATLGPSRRGMSGCSRVGNTAHPTVRLANLIALKHPVSVDTYVERTLSGAKAILVRIIGGEAYWPYGLATLQDLARRTGHRAGHPACRRPPRPAPGRAFHAPRLHPPPPAGAVRRRAGRSPPRRRLAQLALAAGIYAAPVIGDKTVPQMGFYDPERGVIPTPQPPRPSPPTGGGEAPDRRPRHQPAPQTTSTP